MRIVGREGDGALCKILERVLSSSTCFLHAFRVRAPLFELLAEEVRADVAAEMAKGVSLTGTFGHVWKSPNAAFVFGKRIFETRVSRFL